MKKPYQNMGYIGVPPVEPVVQIKKKKLKLTYKVSVKTLHKDSFS